MKTFKEFINESLDKDEKILLNKLKKYKDETILSWAGYDSKKDFEEATDEKYSRELLVTLNYDDLIANLEELG